MSGPIYNPGVGVSGDIVTAARQTVWFYQDNVIANQNNVALCCLGDAVRTTYPMLYSGSIVGVAVVSNAARAAGTLTIDVLLDGVAIGLQAVLDGTNTTTHIVTQAEGLDTFIAGQSIGARITTDAAWLPITADIIVAITTED